MIRVSAVVIIAFAFIVVFSVGNNGSSGFNKIEQECIDFGFVVTSKEFYYAALTAWTSDQVKIMMHDNRFAKLDERVRLENTRMFFEAPSDVYVFYLLDGKLEVKHFAPGRGSILEDKKDIQALPFEVVSLQEKSFLNRIFGGSKFGFFSSSCEPLTESSESKAENCECDQQSICVYDAGLGARVEIPPDEQLYSSMVNMAYCNRFINSGSKLIIHSPWGDKSCVINSKGQMLYEQVQIWQKSWDFTMKECQAFSIDPLNPRPPTPAVTELPRETSSSDYSSASETTGSTPSSDFTGNLPTAISSLTAVYSSTLASKASTEANVNSTKQESGDDHQPPKIVNKDDRPVSVLLIGVMVTSALCAIVSAAFILLIISGRIMAKPDDEVTLPASDEKILSGQDPYFG